jgi:O-antigen/teichoic acid export membrane protein
MQATIQHRFLFSSFSNLLRAVINFATVILIARWLSPEDYGRMMFLLASFLAFKSLIDMASSQAFFTFISERSRSKKFILVYWSWVGLQLIISILIFGFIVPDSFVDTIWVGEKKLMIFLALIATFSQNIIWPIASGMLEAQRDTIKVQKIAICVTFSHFIVVCLLWTIGQLALPALLIALIIEWILGSLYSIKMFKNYKQVSDSKTLNNETFTEILSEFWKYCAPLIPYSWMAFFYVFVDRWMLQHWGGSTEQAFYSLARQFSIITLLATASILRIFWKEISEAYYQNKLDKVKELYQKVSKTLYSFGAIIVGAIIPWSKEILTIFVGEEYIKGTLVLILMLLYTVHQSMGQIGASMLYATKETRLQMKIGMAFMGISLFVAYLLMAPVDHQIMPGFGLASEGLAYKMVALQIIEVNILAWFISRKFGWKYEWLYQIIILGVFLIAGFVIKYIVQIIEIEVIISMIIFSFFYITLSGLLIYFKPTFIGLNSKDLDVFYSQVKAQIRPIK